MSDDRDPKGEMAADADEVASRIAAFAEAADRCKKLLRKETVRGAAEVYRDAVDPALDRLLEASDSALDAGRIDPELRRASDAAELLAEALVEELEALGIEFDELELPILGEEEPG